MCFAWSIVVIVTNPMDLAWEHLYVVLWHCSWDRWRSMWWCYVNTLYIAAGTGEGICEDAMWIRCSVTLQLGPVKEYVKMLCENADVKFIVFAHHRVMLDSISEQLVDDNIMFIRIDGSTLPVDRPVHRTSALFLPLFPSCPFPWFDLFC